MSQAAERLDMIPPAGTREIILSAAQDLVLANGLAAATTRAIAAAAGCSEGTIYRYFPDKNSLVLEIIKSRFPGFFELLSVFPEKAGTATVKANLEEMAVAALAFYRAILPISAGVLSDRELLSAHRLYFEKNHTGPARALAAVAAYIRAEQKLGRVSKQTSPQHAAKLLLGGLFSQAFLFELTGESCEGPGTDPALVTGVVKTLCRALRPEGALSRAV